MVDSSVDIFAHLPNKVIRFLSIVANFHNSCLEL